YQFNHILPAEFGQAAEEVLNAPAVKKIIIDLRNNPGGFLEVAQEVTGWFLAKGRVVTWQDFGTGQERKPYKSNGPSAFEKYQIVVLINNGSASASEIMAGALRDELGAKLIGEKSFGKGSVQEQINLSDKSSLKVTIAKWLTPKGASIDKEGLTPDIEVKEATSTDDGADGADAVTQKAIEFLNNLP
ncbi:MAG: S41 family peptidase, partial [Patescibacteria group bacterium]